MDHTFKEGPSFPVLGEPDLGNAWGAVHGWRGDLRCRGFSTLPGKYPESGPAYLKTLQSDVASYLQEDIISIWNKTASDQATTARIRDTLRRVLNLPPNTIMEYKTHTDSIKYVCLFFCILS